MYYFQSELIRTDVTAVKIWENYIAAGIGGFLHVYHKISSKLVQKIPVFNGSKIFGIVLSKNRRKLLIYGENQLKIFKCDEDFSVAYEIHSLSYKDWILHAIFVNNDEVVAAVSMHNELLLFSESWQLINAMQCEEKCLLYSAYICYNGTELVVLSGTIFSEIIIWKPTDLDAENKTLTRLKMHKGVIFNIDYNHHNGLICSTSDDRSAIVWKIRHKDIFIETAQPTIEITKKFQVFGHLSRIFRCQILDQYFITAGEDSVLNVWSNDDGRLVKKIETHQGGAIWCMDGCELDNFIVTGSGNCGVSRFPIKGERIRSEMVLPFGDLPKITAFLNVGILAFSDTGNLFHFYSLKWNFIDHFHDLKSYCLLEISRLGNLIALVGITGQIYIYEQSGSEILFVSWHQSCDKSRIFSFHWLTNRSFIVCQSAGSLSLFKICAKTISFVSKFVLPASKERWSTCALVTTNFNFVLGDRKGNLHYYALGKIDPVQTIKRVHNHLGVTSLEKRKAGQIISLGRNGILKTFAEDKNGLKMILQDKLPFKWLARIHAKNISGFSGHNFVVYNIDSRRCLMEIDCGGGHRSWAIDPTKFVFIKDKVINRIDLDLAKSAPVDLVAGYHVKEINSIKGLQNAGRFVLVSGSEDTTLKITEVVDNNFNKLFDLKSHLSSIRCIFLHKLDDGRFLIFSAGGRAQIVVWKMQVTDDDVICSEEFSYYEKIDRDASEMRIMDLSVFEMKLYCACSDGNVKIFQIALNETNGKFELVLIENISYALKCIIKICNLSILNQNMLVTMATDGNLVFWKISDELTIFKSIKVHQSGINSYSFHIFDGNKIAFVTGGDDNAMHLNVLRFEVKDDSIEITVLDTFSNVGIHCAQITGAFICGEYVLTASIDHRLVMFEWSFKKGKLKCEFLRKFDLSVADVQGLVCFKNEAAFDVFVYGNGVEHVKINKKYQF